MNQWALAPETTQWQLPSLPNDSIPKVSCSLGQLGSCFYYCIYIIESIWLSPYFLDLLPLQIAQERTFTKLGYPYQNERATWSTYPRRIAQTTSKPDGWGDWAPPPLGDERHFDGSDP